LAIEEYQESRNPDAERRWGRVHYLPGVDVDRLACEVPRVIRRRNGSPGEGSDGDERWLAGAAGALAILGGS
jgi:hypothetical protein